jgi:hypothetical protein
MKHWSSNPQFGLVLLAAAAAATCAKVDDNLPTGAGGSGGTSAGLTNGSGVVNTTHGATTASTAASATSTSGSSTATGGTGTGEAGAPAQTSTTGEGGEHATDSSGGSGGTGGVPPDVIENARIVLLYKVDSSTAATASVFMHLYLRNQGDDEFPLSAAEVRYWFDSDGLSYALASHYQGPEIGPVTLDRGDAGGDEYVAITFGSSANLPANTPDINATEFQVKLDATQGTFDQSNDYSFAPALMSPTEHLRVTVYLADHLVWGCEPSGVCAGDEPGAGGAAGAAGAEG